MGDYSELMFYQKARQVIPGVNDLIKAWPKTIQAQEISHQLFRSSTSIGANIAEAHGRHAGTEYIHYLNISQGSANETDHWLHTAFDLEFGPKDKIQVLIDLNNEVRRMRTAAINTLKAKRSEQRIREESSFYDTETNPPNA